MRRLREEGLYTSPIEFKDTISGLGSGGRNCPFGFCAVGFNILLLLILNPETDYLIILPVNIIAALTFYMLISARKRHKFRHPISNYDLESLVSRAKERLEISRTVELWSIDDDGFVLTRETNLLFSCIVMSNSVINKLLEKPESGEIIIADELVRIEGSSRIFEFVWSLMHFFLFSFTIYAFQETLFQLLLPVGVILIQAVIILLALGLLIFVFSSRNSPPKPDIESIYGKTRFDVEHEVFGKIDRRLFSSMMWSAPRKRIDESSEFSLGMLPTPLIISLICGVATYFTFTVPLSIISEKIPFVVLPLCILFGTIGFAFSFEFLNPIRYVNSQSRHMQEQSLIEDSQTRQLAELLHKIPQYSELEVKKRKTISSNIVTEISQDRDKKHNYAILSDLATQTLELDELLIYSIAEMKRNNIRQQENRWSGRLFGIITFVIILCGFPIIAVLYQPNMEIVILLLFLYIGLLFASIAILNSQVESKLRRVDRDVQREYPSFIHILEKLQDKGYSYGGKAIKERFETLMAYSQNRYLSRESNFVI